MFYAVFAAWSTKSYQNAGTADTGLTRSICISQVHHTFLTKDQNWRAYGENPRFCLFYTVA